MTAEAYSDILVFGFGLEGSKVKALAFGVVALLTSLVKTYSDPFYIFSGGNLIINKTVPLETNTKTKTASSRRTPRHFQELDQCLSVH